MGFTGQMTHSTVSKHCKALALICNVTSMLADRRLLFTVYR